MHRARTLVVKNTINNGIRGRKNKLGGNHPRERIYRVLSISCAVMRFSLNFLYVVFFWENNEKHL